MKIAKGHGLWLGKRLSSALLGDQYPQLRRQLKLTDRRQSLERGRERVRQTPQCARSKCFIRRLEVVLMDGRQYAINRLESGTRSKIGTLRNRRRNYDSGCKRFSFNDLSRTSRWRPDRTLQRGE